MAIRLEDLLASCRRHLRAADVQRVLRRLAATGGFDGLVLISATDEAHMGEHGAPVAPLSFSLRGGDLALDIAHVSDDYEDDGVPTDHMPLVQPVMTRSLDGSAVASTSGRRAQAWWSAPA